MLGLKSNYSYEQHEFGTFEWKLIYILIKTGHRDSCLMMQF